MPSLPAALLDAHPFFSCYRLAHTLRGASMYDNLWSDLASVFVSVLTVALYLYIHLDSTKTEQGNSEFLWIGLTIPKLSLKCTLGHYGSTAVQDSCVKKTLARVQIGPIALSCPRSCWGLAAGIISSCIACPCIACTLETWHQTSWNSSVLPTQVWQAIVPKLHDVKVLSILLSNVSKLALTIFCVQFFMGGSNNETWTQEKF